MTAHTSTYSAPLTSDSLADMLAAYPQTVVDAICAPSHHSDLTGAEVVEVAEMLGIDFAAAPFSVEDLQVGMAMELELSHECAPSMVDALDEDLFEVGKAAVANLQQQPDYYCQMTQAQAPGDPPVQPHRSTDVGSD